MEKKEEDIVADGFLFPALLFKVLWNTHCKMNNILFSHEIYMNSSILQQKSHTMNQCFIKYKGLEDG